MGLFSKVTTFIICAVLIASCSRPYQSGLVEENGQISKTAFSGLLDVIAREDAKLIWVHGMCSHKSDWAERRHRKMVSLANGNTLDEQHLRSKNNAFTVKYTDEIEGNTLESRYLIWSPLTENAKKPLSIDSALDVKRASINQTLKSQLMNDCLADAVAYIGQPGDEIRRWMKSEICDAIGGRIGGGGACILNADYKSTPLLLVSESLGSKMLSDAVLDIWNSSSGSQKNLTAQRLSDIQLVFLLANQIPILDVAQYSDSKQFTASQNQNLPLSVVLADARNQKKRFDRDLTPLKPLRFVEFTDPNDVLSYRLVKGINFPPSTALTNVTVSNAPTLLGVLENPADAHCGYDWNPVVLGMIFYGYNGKRVEPVTGPIEKNKCF